VREALARFAEVASAEDEYLQSLSDAAYWSCQSDDGALSLTAWFGYPTAIQRRVMLAWLRERTGARDVSFERVMSVCDLALTWRLGAKVEIGCGLTATIIGRDLVAGTPGDVLDHAWARFPGPRIALGETESFRISDRGETTIGEFVFRADPSKPKECIVGREWIPLNSPDDGAWTVRALQRDDRFRNGHRVADWMRENRVPIMVRQDVIGVFDGEFVVWIPGLPLPARLQESCRGGEVYVRWYKSHSSTVLANEEQG
jgi:hypothetical protein